MTSSTYNEVHSGQIVQIPCIKMNSFITGCSDSNIHDSICIWTNNREKILKYTVPIDRNVATSLIHNGIHIFISENIPEGVSDVQTHSQQ